MYLGRRSPGRAPAASLPPRWALPLPFPLPRPRSAGRPLRTDTTGTSDRVNVRFVTPCRNNRPASEQLLHAGATTQTAGLRAAATTTHTEGPLPRPLPTGPAPLPPSRLTAPPARPIVVSPPMRRHLH